MSSAEGGSEVSAREFFDEGQQESRADQSFDVADKRSRGAVCPFAGGKKKGLML